MTATSPRPEVLLGVRGLRKAYGRSLAVDDVGFDVTSGSIHALLGGNGSGKSTTIKILAGVVSADAGEIHSRGVSSPASAQTAERARAMGLRFVHQQNSTFGDMTVAENLALGSTFETGLGGRIRWRRQREHAANVLTRLELDVSPDARVETLGSAVQMMVAIGRALQDQDELAAGVLVLDEPTASLPKSEVDLLLEFLTRRALAGQGIILVTHRLNEVLRIANHATVLRDGKVAANLTRETMTHDSLVEAIMGQQLVAVTEKERQAHRDDAVRIDSRPEILILKGRGASLDLAVRPGECLGLAGLLGSGRSSLLRRIFGVMPREEELTIEGTSVERENPSSAMAAGIAYVPEDRVRDALFAELSIARNLSITRLSETSSGLGVMSWRRERSRAMELIAEFGVKASSCLQPIGSLSGGNQQKVVLARWMQRNPKVLLLDEPTQGVDVGARAEIHRLVGEACRRGMAVIVVSSEFDELVALCDKVLIVHRGQAVEQVGNDDLTEESLNARVFAKEAVSQ